MVPGRIDCYDRREVEGSDRAAKWKPVQFVICFWSGRRLHLHFIGMGRRSERQRGFMGALVCDHTCAPPVEMLHDRGC